MDLTSLESKILLQKFVESVSDPHLIFSIKFFRMQNKFVDI